MEIHIFSNEMGVFVILSILSIYIAFLFRSENERWYYPFKTILRFGLKFQKQVVNKLKHINKSE